MGKTTCLFWDKVYKKGDGGLAIQSCVHAWQIDISTELCAPMTVKVIIMCHREQLRVAQYW